MDTRCGLSLGVFDQLIFQGMHGVGSDSILLHFRDNKHWKMCTKIWRHYLYFLPRIFSVRNPRGWEPRVSRIGHPDIVSEDVRMDFWSHGLPLSNLLTCNETWNQIWEILSLKGQRGKRGRMAPRGKSTHFWLVSDELFNSCPWEIWTKNLTEQKKTYCHRQPL